MSLLRSLAVGLGVVWLLAGVPEISAQSWPTFRNDVARSGYSRQPLDAAHLQMAWQWKSELPPNPAWDGPARWDAYNLIRDLPAMRQYDGCFHPVSDGKSLFLGSSSQDTLFCFDLKSGKINWSFVAGGPIRLAPTLDGDRILFGCDDGYAYCLDRTTGKLRWKFSPSEYQGAEQRRLINNDRLISFFPIRTGVAVRDGIAYFGASFLPWRESWLCGVSAKTGKPDQAVGGYVVKHENVTLEGNLLIADDRLIVPQGRIAPMLFDRTTGKSQGSLPGGGGVTIVLTEEGEIVRGEGGRASRPGQLGVFRGKERVASFPRGRSIVVQDDLFFVIDGKKLFAANRKNNELKWKREVDEPLELIMAGKTLFVGGRDHVTAVDGTTGRVVWSAPTEGRVFGLAVAGKRLIASTDTGHVYVFEGTAPVAWSESNSKNEKGSGKEATWKSPPVAPVRSKSLQHRWVFHRSAMRTKDRQPVTGTQLDHSYVRDQASGAHLELAGTATAIPVGKSQKVEAVALNGTEFRPLKRLADSLPRKTLSVEAWVRVDQPAKWGGIVGCFQDDGSTEHGWVLGYRNDHFCFALAGGKGGLTYMDAPKAFQLKTWNHLVGTYNGKEMRLYINGSLAASSQAEQGPISYSKPCQLTVGSYHDPNEFFPMIGALQEVRVYTIPLEAPIIAKIFAAKADAFPISKTTTDDESDWIAWGPIARFVQPGQAEIRYGTIKQVPTTVDLIGEHSVRSVSDPTPKNEHRVVLTGLPWRREVQFQIRSEKQGNEHATRAYTLDTHFDWTLSQPEPMEPEVARLVKEIPNPRGLAMVVGAERADWARKLARQTQLTVVLAVADEPTASAIRTRWMQDDQVEYGPGLSVIGCPIKNLPAASAGLVIGEDQDMSRRLVRPEGGVLYDGEQIVWKRGSLSGRGVWSHMYGTADNSAFGGEHLADVSSKNDLVTQWIGRPGPRYQTDRQNRKPSPLASGGRFFLQGQQRLIGMDAYSGTILWSNEMPTVMRWNVPHDCSNWCSDDRGVYVAARDRVWFLDGRTGDIARQYLLPDGSGSKEKSWGYVARYHDRLIGSVVATDAIYAKWWGPSQWFDSTGGGDTHVVAADRLFSLDVDSGKVAWQYDGLVLHPTITILDDRIFFVEDKTPSHLQSKKRRLSLDAQQQLEIVCLDAATGQPKWRKPIPPFAGHLAALYLAGGGNPELRSLVLCASVAPQKKFTLRTLDPEDGTVRWAREIAWESNNHGKHIARPAIENDLVYVRPEVVNLKDGKTVRRGFPKGHGCSSYTLSVNGLFSRLGETTWWDVRHNRVNRFNRIRTDCWISVVPAQGMLLSAEGGGGCSCGSWLETSLGFLPRRVDEDFPDSKNPQEGAGSQR